MRTGTAKRFSSKRATDFPSYRTTPHAKKDQGNTKNGNKYLAWAYVEAANFAVRYSARIKSFYQRKKSKTNGIVALKAVAHKLCRACNYIIKDQVAFDLTRAFA
jgi:transposase